MDRRDFLKLGGMTAGIAPLLTTGCGGRGGRTGRPNILFICVDQHNARKAGFAGHSLVQTPNLDKLAARGTVFSNCYSNSPVCVPARAAMFTGLYPHEVGAYDNASPFDGRVPTWAARLRDDAGYRSLATGKLDFLYNRDYGFEERRTEHGHDTSPDITAYFRDPIVPRLGSRALINGYIDEQPHGDQRLAEEAVSFLSEEAAGLDRPWLFYLGLNSPHPEWRIPRKYFEMYPLENLDMPVVPGGWPPDLHPVLAMTNHYNRFDEAPFPEEDIRRARAAYYGMITMLDQWLGTVLNALDKSGQAENTVVVFTSDHGEMLGEHGMWLKGDPYDGAAQVPLIIAGPGIGKGKVDAPVSHVDLAATILELGGLKPFPGIRGRSVLPLVRGDENPEDRVVYCELNNEGTCTGTFWVRKGPWKFIHFVGRAPLLFNLDDDPGEFVNLAGREKYRGPQKMLESLLRDSVDPEKVSAQAFADQRRRLNEALARLDDPAVYRGFERRLGADFAERLKEKKEI